MEEKQWFDYCMCCACGKAILKRDSVSPIKIMENFVFCEECATLCNQISGKQIRAFFFVQAYDWRKG